jgi:hypothetical protein
MKYKDFIAELKRVNSEFRFVDNLLRMRMIRTLLDDKLHCPLTIVCNSLKGQCNDAGDWVRAAEFLRIQYKLAKKITRAADYKFFCNWKIRYDLKRAVKFV